jgi:hypothetical protein
VADNYKIEYKIVKKNDVQTSTTQAKYTCPDDQVRLVGEILNDPNLEFLTVRRVRPVKANKQEVKK